MSSTLDLARWIRPGDTVVCGQAAAEPLGLTRALAEQRHRFPGARVFLGAVFSRSFAPAHADALRFSGYGAMGRAAALFDADGGSIVPIHYRELEAAFASGRLHADVVLMQVPAGTAWSMRMPCGGRAPQVQGTASFTSAITTRARVAACAT